MNAAVTMAMVESDLMPLAAAAAELHMTVKHVRRLSAEGRFPSLLKVTQKHYLVSRSEFEAWKAGRWTKSISTAAAVKVEAVDAVNRRAAPRRRGVK